jgi:hypothetical protein
MEISLMDAHGPMHHIIVREIERRSKARFEGFSGLNLLPTTC